MIRWAYVFWIFSTICIYGMKTTNALFHIRQDFNCSNQLIGLAISMIFKWCKTPSSSNAGWPWLKIYAQYYSTYVYLFVKYKIFFGNFHRLSISLFDKGSMNQKWKKWKMKTENVFISGYSLLSFWLKARNLVCEKH